MPSYPIPDNEAQRLQAVAALAHAAGTPDPTLDALVRVATQAFGVPAAVISLMQADHQVFVARVGVDVSELARHESLCNPLLAAPQAPRVVEDLRADPRYATHPLVQGEAGLRLYAGAALCDEQGLALGTLVLLDTQPWPTWTDAQHQTLQDLALIASRTLQSGRRLRELAQLAEVDTLTGLRPAAHFQAILEVELAHAMRTGEPFALLALEIDGIDTIEEGFGRPAAETVLHDTVQRLAQQVRLGDVLARLGPARFGVLMRHGGDEEAEGLRRRISQAVTAPLVLPSGDEVGVGLAVGVAAYSDTTESLHQLQAEARTALEADRALQARRWQAFTLTR
jgi:diguanylate cyclase (GGDEF)-like protein